MSIRYSGSLSCLRCATRHPDPAVELLGRGCPSCAREGVPANVLADYEITPGPVPLQPDQPGLFRFRDALPLAATTPAVSLAEGGTPLVDLPQLATRLDLGRVLLKDETRNPTWSYKDRLAAVLVTKAVELDVDTVVVASTGNHGAAIAAYAARAGLRCVVLTVSSVPATMKTLMQCYGARVVALERPRDRWALMHQLVEDRGWLPTSGSADPPVGSPGFGVDGYKTIAFELVESLGYVPDAVVVPVAYADGLAGITRGFADLLALGVTTRLPRMVAAEPFGPLAAALAADSQVAGPVDVEPSVAFSTASPYGTFQGLQALRSTRGVAVAVPDSATILDAQLALGREAGIYAEASTVTGLVALESAARELGPGSTVVVIGTSTGLKDVGATASRLAEVPVIEPTLESFDAVDHLSAVGSGAAPHAS